MIEPLTDDPDVKAGLRELVAGAARLRGAAWPRFLEYEEQFGRLWHRLVGEPASCRASPRPRSRWRRSGAAWPCCSAAWAAIPALELVAGSAPPRPATACACVQRLGMSEERLLRAERTAELVLLPPVLDCLPDARSSTATSMSGWWPSSPTPSPAGRGRPTRCRPTSPACARRPSARSARAARVRRACAARPRAPGRRAPASCGRRAACRRPEAAVEALVRASSAAPQPRSRVAGR